MTISSDLDPLLGMQQKPAMDNHIQKITRAINHIKRQNFTWFDHPILTFTEKKNLKCYPLSSHSCAFLATDEG